jgi:hypothetical protein
MAIARDFYLLQNVQTVGTPSLLFNGQQCSFPVVKRPDVMLTIHLCLASRLRMSGDMLLLPLYAYMAWTGTALLFSRWAVFLTPDIFTVTWHSGTFCWYYLIILTLCVFCSRILDTGKIVRTGILWIYINLQANHQKDPTMMYWHNKKTSFRTQLCSGHTLRSTAIQFRRSSPSCIST